MFGGRGRRGRLVDLRNRSPDASKHPQGNPGPWGGLKDMTGRRDFAGWPRFCMQVELESWTVWTIDCDLGGPKANHQCSTCMQCLGQPAKSRRPAMSLPAATGPGADLGVPRSIRTSVAGVYEAPRAPSPAQQKSLIFLNKLSI